MARLFGVGVRSFTIGFGKQFLSWIDPKTGTSWGIAPFPLGGYVGLLGEKHNNDGSNASDVKASDVISDVIPNVIPNVIKTAPTVMGKPFMAAPLYAKLCILLAGPLVNILFAALLYCALSYNAPNPALPILAAPVSGSPAQAAGVQAGDTVTQVNDQPVQSWRDVQMVLAPLNDIDTDKDRPIEAVRLQVQRGALKQTVDLKFQIVTVATTAITTAKTPAAPVMLDERLGLQLATGGLKVIQVLPDGAAQLAGLQADDVMLAIDGVLIDSPDVLFEALKQYESTHGAAANTALTPLTPLTPLKMTVLHQKKPQFLDVKPIKNAQGEYKIGVHFGGVWALSEHSLTLPQVLREGLNTSYTAIVMTLQALGKFFLKPWQSEQLGGPITIAKMAKTSVDNGWSSVLMFIAGLSISVGVLNLLPVPMLDGGQMVYHTVRQLTLVTGLAAKMRDKQSTIYVNQIWNYFGVVFVVLLTMVAFASDIRRLL
jgi:regulator of sigma E protease